MRTKPILGLVLAALLIAGLLAGCQAAQPTAAPAASSGQPAALVVKGKVATELSLTMDDVTALGLVKFQAEHPKKGPQDYEGVPIKTLLDKAGAKGDAKEIVMTASDGFTGTVALADIANCEHCALAVEKGKLGGVFPGLPSNTWVKDVVSIEVK